MNSFLTIPNMSTTRYMKKIKGDTVGQSLGKLLLHFSETHPLSLL